MLNSIDNKIFQISNVIVALFGVATAILAYLISIDIKDISNEQKRTSHLQALMAIGEKASKDLERLESISQNIKKNKNSYANAINSFSASGLQVINQGIINICSDGSSDLEKCREEKKKEILKIDWNSYCFLENSTKENEYNGLFYAKFYMCRVLYTRPIYNEHVCNVKDYIDLRRMRNKQDDDEKYYYSETIEFFKYFNKGKSINEKECTPSDL